MKIWGDADACPNVIKEILFRLADRAKVMATLVANQTLVIPDYGSTLALIYGRAELYYDSDRYKV